MESHCAATTRRMPFMGVLVYWSAVLQEVNYGATGYHGHVINLMLYS